MKYTFRTKWKDNQIACVCTLDKKCEHARSCEKLDFKLNPYDGIEECMSERSYKRKKGALRQVKQDE